MQIKLLKPFALLFLLTVSSLSFAQMELTSITPLKQGDIQNMDKQRKSIDDLARRYLGTQIRQQRSNDLEVLQKLLDKRLISKDQTLELQAMGVVLWDLYVKELGVHWVVYRDRAGKSRALQWSDKKDVLFPITMISRRAEVGIHVDVAQLYNKGLNILRSIMERAARDGKQSSHLKFSNYGL